MRTKCGKRTCIRRLRACWGEGGNRRESGEASLQQQRTGYVRPYHSSRETPISLKSLASDGSENREMSSLIMPCSALVSISIRRQRSAWVRSCSLQWRATIARRLAFVAPEILRRGRWLFLGVDGVFRAVVPSTVALFVPFLPFAATAPPEVAAWSDVPPRRAARSARWSFHPGDVRNSASASLAKCSCVDHPKRWKSKSW